MQGSKINNKKKILDRLCLHFLVLWRRRNEEGKNLKRHLTHPFLHSLLFSSWSLIIPTMISSLTRPPASMIFFASLPKSVCFVTCSRNMSPVARWHTQNFSFIRGAWVPFPEQRHLRLKEKAEVKGVNTETRREKTRKDVIPVGLGRIMSIRRVREGERAVRRKRRTGARWSN